MRNNYILLPADTGAAYIPEKFAFWVKHVGRTLDNAGLGQIAKSMLPIVDFNDGRMSLGYRCDPATMRRIQRLFGWQDSTMDTTTSLLLDLTGYCTGD